MAALRNIMASIANGFQGPRGSAPRSQPPQAAGAGVLKMVLISCDELGHAPLIHTAAETHYQLMIATVLMKHIGMYPCQSQRSHIPQIEGHRAIPPTSGMLLLQTTAQLATKPWPVFLSTHLPNNTKWVSPSLPSTVTHSSLVPQGKPTSICTSGLVHPTQ